MRLSTEVGSKAAHDRPRKMILAAKRYGIGAGDDDHAAKKAA